MASHFLIIFVFSLVFASYVNGGVHDDDVSFDENYVPVWGFYHLTRVNNSKEVQLRLDQSSGSGFRSKSDYGSGRFGIRMKLPDANTTGIIISFYLTSAPDNYNPGNHDEIDFEFVGGTHLQTNVFAGDSGNREEKYQLWFDPTKDFHYYEILWNQYNVVFYVDKVPVRIFKNNTDMRVNYFSKPMHAEASIWNAEWAGTVDWNQGPFITSYRRFGIDGCVSQKNSDINQECLTTDLEWNIQRQLNQHEQLVHENFRKNHVVYNYCLDPKRQQNHQECGLSPQPHI